MNPAQRTPRVLVADDDASTRMLLRASVEAVDMQVIEAEDGDRAWDLLRGEHPDLALLDVEMPGLDGFQLCARIRAHPELQRVPVIMVTSHDNLESVNRAFEAGATTFVTKPINWSLLQHQIRYVLRSSLMFEDLLRSQAREHFLAYHDPVTKLANRVYLEEVLQYAIPAAMDQERHGALLLVGLDRFKRVNESLGHAAGDDLLRSVAERLAGCLRSHADPPRASVGNRPSLDTLCRFGDDEFAILLPDLADPRDAARVAERLVKVLGEPCEVVGQEMRLCASIGIALCPRDGDNSGDLLRNASAAMVAVKRQGGDGQRFYNTDMHQSQLLHLRLEGELVEALARGQLQMHYQPKVDRLSGCMTGAEALARWPHPVRGMVPPSRFIPLAEETGLIAALGIHALDLVCRHIKAWRQAGLTVPVIAINISPRQFWQADFFQQVMEVLNQHGVAPGDLELELTETAFILDLEATLPLMHSLRAEGFRLAIDDFGTGYSSLNYLARLPADVLKVDQSFIQAMLNDQAAALIVNMVADVGCRLGLTVVAEGVEAERQRQALETTQCHQLQGFLISPPVPEPAFAGLLKRGLDQFPRLALG